MIVVDEFSFFVGLLIGCTSTIISFCALVGFLGFFMLSAPPAF